MTLKCWKHVERKSERTTATAGLEVDIELSWNPSQNARLYPNKIGSCHWTSVAGPIRRLDVNHIATPTCQRGDVNCRRSAVFKDISCACTNRWQRIRMGIDKCSDRPHPLFRRRDFAIRQDRIARRCHDCQGASIHRCGQLCHIRPLGNAEGCFAYRFQVSESLQILGEYRTLKGIAVLIKRVSQFKSKSRSTQEPVREVNGPSWRQITNIKSIVGKCLHLVGDGAKSCGIPICSSSVAPIWLMRPWLGFIITVPW